MTHGPKLGVLGLVRVVVQTDDVKSRLHLIAASPEHVISAVTLTAHLVAPVGGQEVEDRRAGRKSGAEPGTPRGRRKTHWLLMAPPRSQSHGRQPFMSLLRPQCSSWKRESRVAPVLGSFSAAKEASEAVTGSHLVLSPLSRQ